MFHVWRLIKKDNNFKVISDFGKMADRTRRRAKRTNDFANRSHAGPCPKGVRKKMSLPKFILSSLSKRRAKVIKHSSMGDELTNSQNVKLPASLKSSHTRYCVCPGWKVCMWYVETPVKRTGAVDRGYLRRHRNRSSNLLTGVGEGRKDE